MILPILTYHRILPDASTPSNDPQRISVDRDQFRSYMKWLRRLGYQTIRLEDYVKVLRGPLTPTRLRQGFGGQALSHKGRGEEEMNAVAPSGGEGARVKWRTFAITFDDGYEEVLTLGLPILQEFGFTATLFAVPGEERNRWDDNQAKLLTPAQLRQWRDAGMDIGAHSCRHVHLTKVDSGTASGEIRNSKKILEDILGQPVKLFAYPYGESDDRVDILTREAAFEAAFATDRAPRDHRANLYRMRRSVVFPRNTVWEIICKAQRWYPAYQDWKKR